MSHSPKKTVRCSPCKRKQTNKKSRKPGTKSSKSRTSRSRKNHSKSRNDYSCKPYSKRHSKRRSRRQSRRRSRRQSRRRNRRSNSLVNRLKAANWKFYGADWCGFTRKQIDELGGKGKVRGLYIDCEKNKSKCQDVEGLPAWKRDQDTEFNAGFKDKAALKQMLR